MKIPPEGNCLSSAAASPGNLGEKEPTLSPRVAQMMALWDQFGPALSKIQPPIESFGDERPSPPAFTDTPVVQPVPRNIERFPSYSSGNKSTMMRTPGRKSSPDLGEKKSDSQNRHRSSKAK